MSPDFGENLKKIREENGWSLEELAERLGSTKQVLSRYERGERTPKITMAAHFADHLGIPLEDLIGHESKAPKKTVLRNEQRDDDYDRLEALHQNPRLGLLFDRSRKMSHEDVEFMLQMADRILKERDGDD